MPSKYPAHKLFMTRGRKRCSKEKIKMNGFLVNTKTKNKKTKKKTFFFCFFVFTVFCCFFCAIAFVFLFCGFSFWDLGFEILFFFSVFVEK